MFTWLPPSDRSSPLGPIPSSDERSASSVTVTAAATASSLTAGAAVGGDGAGDFFGEGAFFSSLVSSFSGSVLGTFGFVSFSTL